MIDAATTIIVVLVILALLGAGLFMVSIAFIDPLTQTVCRGVAVAAAVVVVIIYLSPLLRTLYTCW
ncbi:hypothetical protein DPV79_16080 [Burkholderia reimsis]|uniref:Uncharacterized protein n=1 Tax=Burkholderia reimsis TaxID=2234132 RepID=A0A365QV17_9BURK|nr:hypothetical protein [Burkholderia reimsis]RBB38898.1 hypothetical protein DPV79_16080 [Burkholderia reimsis]